MLFIPINIQDDNRRGPLHAETVDQGLVLVKIDLEGNELFRDAESDVRLGVGNSFQLLTPHSNPVVEIGQDQFPLLPRLRLGRCQGRFPTRSSHDRSPPL